MLLEKHPAWPRTVQDWRLVLHVISVILLVRLLLLTKPLPDVVAHLMTTPIEDEPQRARTSQAATFIDGFLTRFPAHPKGNCLPRSLALMYFASRHGIPVQFHCGIRKVGNTALEGHAWLSVNHEPFLETNRSVHDYTVTFSLPSDATMATHRSNSSSTLSRCASSSQVIRGHRLL